MSYEEMILEKQENDNIDDCSVCPNLDKCRKASKGEGEYPKCPMT